MKILVTGFTPFGGENINPAYEAVKALPKEIKGVEIITLEIPTVFGCGAKAVEEAIKIHLPDVVICVGQATGRSCISIEKVAINFKDARIPDNEGNQPIDSPILQDGKNAYFATLPVKAMVEHVRKNHIPAHLSYSAGTYVCNEVMYLLLQTLEKSYPHVQGGFIHVPLDTAQAVKKANGVASMPIATITKGLEYAIEAIID